MGLKLMAESASIDLLAAKRRVSDAVADLIMNRIISGEYPEEEYLPSEKNMMSEFDVGRVSIREAIASLRWKGFLIVKQGERPRVTRPSPDMVIKQISYAAQALLSSPGGVTQFNEARLIFEQGVVQFVIAHGDENQIAKVYEVHSKNEYLLENPTAFVDGDIAFHRELVNITKNPILISSHMALVEWLILDRLQRSQKNLRQSHDEHAEILDAIKRKNVVDAISAVSHHLDRTTQPASGV